MGISVENKMTRAIQVAINKWGNDGHTEFFTIEPGKTEKWDRSDDRGFVMSVQHDGARHPYFVQSDSAIVFSPDNQIKDHGQVINPVAS